MAQYIDVVVSLLLFVIGAIIESKENARVIPQHFGVYITVPSIVLYIWPLFRALSRNRPSQLILAISALVVLSSAMFGPKALSLLFTSESFFFSVPLVLFSVLPGPIPKLVWILGICEAILVVFLHTGWGTPPEVHFLLKLLVWATLVPSIIWYVVHWERVWQKPEEI